MEWPSIAEYMSGMSRDCELDWSLVRKSVGPTSSILIFTPLCSVYCLASAFSVAACPRDWFMKTTSEPPPDELLPPDPQAASVVAASPPPTAPRKPRRDRNGAVAGEAAS